MPDAQYHFDPIQWQDDQDGGAVGYFYGTLVLLEAGGSAHGPVWTVSFANERYGYQRGARDGERTLADIKAIAEADAQARAIGAYERAKDTVARFRKRHLGKEG